MTRENFDKAKAILKDIYSLENIKSEYKDRHWVSFYGAVVKEQPINTGMLRDDFEKFIDAEIAKLEEESKKL